MFRSRGELSAKRTKRIVEKLGSMIPLNGEEIVSDFLLESKDVAKFLFNLASIEPKESPDTYILFKNSHLNLEKVMKEEFYKKEIINYKINKLNLLFKDNNIVLSSDIIDFLNNLRATYLNRYLEKNNISSKYLEKKILSSNLSIGNNILQRYPKIVSKDTFIDMSIRMMSNYP